MLALIRYLGKDTNYKTYIVFHCYLQIGDLILPVGEDDNREIDIDIGEVNRGLIDFRFFYRLTQIVLVSCGAGGEYDHETV